MQIGETFRDLKSERFDLGRSASRSKGNNRIGVQGHLGSETISFSLTKLML
jgi:hypothetical protein